MYELKKDYLKNYTKLQLTVNRLGEQARRYPERWDECQKEIELCQNKRNEIEQKIDAVADPLLRELLYGKYVFGKNLEELSVSLNYSKRHVQRLHTKALAEFSL